MSIIFGIPRKEIINKEKYPNQPVLTMLAVEDKGFNRKFVLNKKAVDLLQLIPGISHVAFAFDGEGSAYVSKNNTEDSFLLGKNIAFSNKKYYEYIVKIYGLDSAMDSDFELIDPVAIGDIIVYRMKYIVPGVVFVPHVNPVIDKEVEHLAEEEHINFKELLEAEELYMNDLLDEETGDLDVDESTGEIIERGKEKFIMNAY